MGRAAFDDLRVIRREYDSKIGCSEVCEAPGGRMYIRLRIRSSRCQKEYLAGKSPAPVRLERGILEVLLPCRDGDPADAWLRREPGLAPRRAACLALIAQCVDQQAAPSVTALAARLENLRFQDQSAWLQLLPDWSDWRPDAGPGGDVAAVAALCRRILTDGFSPFQSHQFPRQLQLLCARQACGGYQTWGQLQQDLTAIPDDLLPLAGPCRARVKRLVAWGKRWVRPAASVAVTLLAVAALISLWGAFREWRSGNHEPAWPGVVSVGDQQLKDG